MRLWFACFVLAAASLSGAGSAHAFDGRRSGFIFGGGVGAGMTVVHQDARRSVGHATGDQTEFGIATDFRIGRGFGERFQLYYTNRLNWFRTEDSDGKSFTVGTGVGLAGASYYFSDRAPSFYAQGLVGVATWQTPFVSGSDVLSGFGIGAGAGWEFIKHWSVEATAMWGGKFTQDIGVDRIQTDAKSILVTITGVAY